MVVRASEPRSIGGVLDDAIGLYRHSLRRIWPLTLALALIGAVPGVVMGLDLVGVSPQRQVFVLLGLLKTPSAWLSGLVIYLLYAVAYAALVSALDAIATRGVVSLADAFGVAMSLAARFIGASLLLALILLVGFALLLIPGVYLSGIFQLALIALVVERGGVIDSFRASASLIKGYWWRSAIIITVAVIITIVFSVIGGIASEAAVSVLGQGVGTVLIQRLLVTALNVVLISMLPCFLLALYYDLKLRHEGGDLAARVAALAAG